MWPRPRRSRLAALTILPWVREWQVDDPVLLVVLSGFAAGGRAAADPGAAPARARAGHDLGRVRVRDPAAVRPWPGSARVRRELGDRRRDRARVAAQDPVQRGSVPARDRRRRRRAAARPLASDGADHRPELPIVLAAGAVFFATNHVLACVAGALLARVPIAGYLREDLAFQAWTAGCVLAFAPALVASADASVALVPVCFVPMLAVYFGGRQAALSSHRANHDALTGLPNRSALSETLQRVATRRRARAPPAHGDVARPRRLQVDQRHARPRARGPHAPAGRAPAAPGGRRAHRARADRRRRVRGAGRRRGRPRRRSSPSGCSRRSTSHSRSTRWRFTSARASASRASRSTAAPRPS